MLMASSVVLLGSLVYPTVFTSRDMLELPLTRRKNLFENKALEEVLSGRAIEYNTHTPVVSGEKSDHESIGSSRSSSRSKSGSTAVRTPEETGSRVRARGAAKRTAKRAARTSFRCF